MIKEDGVFTDEQKIDKNELYHFTHPSTPSHTQSHLPTSTHKNAPNSHTHP